MFHQLEKKFSLKIFDDQFVVGLHVTKPVCGGPRGPAARGRLCIGRGHRPQHIHQVKYLIGRNGVSIKKKTVHYLSQFVNYLLLIYIFFLGGGGGFVGHFFADFAHFIFLRDVWIRTQSAAVGSRRNQLCHPSPLLSHHLQT
jgi:hypothetical protein